MKRVVGFFIFGAIIGIPLTALFGPVGAAVAVFIISAVISAKK